MSMSKQSPNGTPYCRTCGFSGCPSLTEGGDCPRWPAREPAGIFGALTDGELFTLSAKLSGWGHQFFQVGEALGKVALERTTDRSLVGDPVDVALWDLRRLYCDAMDEIHEIAAAARLARASLQPASA